MTTPLFLLRCLEIGLSMSDLDLLTIGMVLDIWTEKGNDDYKYDEKEVVRTARQQDFDNF
ncbi:MAG: hypothetical protein IJV41_01505 [Oscillospiraceae bacterium]|nr:hypothetical protein [Oscillospiraceae bacterium]